MPADRILERNRAYVAGRAARPLPEVQPIRLAVVACYDPRLDDLLLPALGLTHGEAFLFRSAGAQVRSEGLLRSLGLAVYMFGVREVVVVGHTSCRMAQFDSRAFIDMFRARGVPREAFGASDLREWTGAIASPASGVRQSMSAIATAPFLPRDLAVSGLVLDDATGALEVVGRAEPAVPPAAAEPAPAPAPDRAGAPAEEPAAEEPASDELDASLREFALRVRSKARLRGDFDALRAEFGRPGHPLAKLRTLDTFARKASVHSRDVLEAYQRVQRALSAEPRPDFERLIRLLRGAVEGP